MNWNNELKDELENKINNQSWDEKIANFVVQKKTRNKNRFVFSLISLIFLFFLVFGLFVQQQQISKDNENFHAAMIQYFEEYQNDEEFMDSYEDEIF